MILQIVIALSIGAYVVLSKDAQPKRPDAALREPFQHPPDQLDCAGRPEFSDFRRAAGPSRLYNSVIYLSGVVHGSLSHRRHLTGESRFV